MNLDDMSGNATPVKGVDAARQQVNIQANITATDEQVYANTGNPFLLHITMIMDHNTMYHFFKNHFQNKYTPPSKLNIHYF